MEANSHLQSNINFVGDVNQVLQNEVVEMTQKVDALSQKIAELEAIIENFSKPGSTTQPSSSNQSYTAPSAPTTH